METPWQDLERSIREALGAAFVIESRNAAGGGCINECHVVRGRGQVFFVKLNAPERREMFAAEAAGLEEIGQACTIRVPRQVCHGANRAASWIVLWSSAAGTASGRSRSTLRLALTRCRR